MAGKDWSGTLHTLGLVALASFSIENQLTLLHSYRLVDTAISSISEGIVVVDRELCIQRINLGGEQILRAKKESLLGHSDVYKRQFYILVLWPSYEFTAFAFYTMRKEY